MRPFRLSILLGTSLSALAVADPPTLAARPNIVVLLVDDMGYGDPPYFYIQGDHAVMPPTNHIAEHHSEGWTATQGEFWRGGGIAPDLKLNDVLPKLTDEACTIRRINGSQTSASAAHNVVSPGGSGRTRFLPAPH